MDEQFIRDLLTGGETVNVEFKSEIDLKSNYGKTKFIKEMLALANSPVAPGYLFIGVEDDGTPVGFNGITDEQLQQIVADNCRRALFFSFHIEKIDDVEIGIITIPRSTRKPHTTNGTHAWNEGKKQKEITNKQVFLRRGKKIDLATPDEVVEMSQDEDSNTEQLERMNNNLERLSYGLDEISRSIDWLKDTPSFPEDIDRFDDTVIAGAIVGLGLGLLSGLGWMPNFLGVFMISFIIMLFLPIVKVNGFRFGRIIVTSFFLGVFINLLSIGNLLPADPVASFFETSLGGPFMFQVVMKNVLIGSLSGLIIALLEKRGSV